MTKVGSRMKFFNDLRLAIKLPVLMVFLSAVALGITGSIAYFDARAALEDEYHSRLGGEADFTAAAIASWLATVQLDARAQSKNPFMREALWNFSKEWDTMGDEKKAELRTTYIDENPFKDTDPSEMLGPKNRAPYTRLHKRFHPFLRELQITKGYSDILLISTTGAVVYSVRKNADFATNVLEDPQLARIVAEVASETSVAGETFEDFVIYTPLGQEATAFIAAPIHAVNGTGVGAMVFALPLAALRDVVTPQDQSPSEFHGTLTAANFTIERPATGRETLPAGSVATMDHPVEVSFLGTTWGLNMGIPFATVYAGSADLLWKIGESSAIALVLVGLLGLLLARSISSPLIRTSLAMNNISQGDYTTQVRHANRRDEIGVIARNLAQFRDQLGEAAEIQLESAFKGAGFAQSTSPMMIIDQSSVVTYTNEALGTFFETHRAAFDPALDGANLVGKNLSDLGVVPVELRQEIQQAETTRLTSQIPVGQAQVLLEINSVYDASGDKMGFIVEWKDVTRLYRNSAIVTSIEDHQCKAEIDPAGHILSLNQNLADVLSAEAADIVGTHVSELMNPAEMASQDCPNFWAETLGGAPAAERFICAHTDEEHHLDGTISPVVDHDGAIVRLVFIAKDVTQAQKAILAAADAAAQAAKRQSVVVDALRVALTNLSAGDLASKIDVAFDSEYEQLRVDFNRAVETLDQAMVQVIDNAELIRGEATEISRAADDLSARTENQAATLEQTASSLDEITKNVQASASGALTTNNVVDEAKTNAENSGVVVRQAVEAMSNIQNSSEKISKIVDVIDEISFQTNLLALNAGVEAARAGDAGRGFAVVASEVRALALRSSDAAREIGGLISESSSHVKNGVELVDSTGEVLQKILASFGDISELVSEIASSADAQSKGLSRVNQSVISLDQVTQENAAMFEETNAASHALTHESEALNRAVGQFTTTHSQAHAPRASNPASKPTLVPETAQPEALQRTPQPEPEAPSFSSVRPPRAAAINPRQQQKDDPAETQMLAEDWEDF